MTPFRSPGANSDAEDAKRIGKNFRIMHAPVNHWEERRSEGDDGPGDILFDSLS
jgi:hypothetical protein